MFEDKLKKIRNKAMRVQTYIYDIHDVIIANNPNTNVHNSKDLHLIAGEIENLLLDRATSNNVCYLDGELLSDAFITIQVPVFENTQSDTYVTVQSSSRTLITTSAGTDIYDTINRRVKLSNTLPVNNTVEVNSEGWKPLNFKIKTTGKFDKFVMNNQNAVAVKCSFMSTENLNEAFMENPNLRVATLLNLDSCIDMSYCFKNCIDLMNIEADLSHVQNLEGVFMGCNSLTSLTDLDLSNCENATDMLLGCNNLQYITISPNCTQVPDELDISPCAKVSLANTIKFLNSLPINDTGELKTVYIHQALSLAQRDSFKSKGYLVIQK